MEAYSLHSVRKPLAKPGKRPSNAPKIYRVDPMNFRDLVQKLTAAPEFMSQSHQMSSSQLQLPQRVSPSSSSQLQLPRRVSPSSSSQLQLPRRVSPSSLHNQNYSDNTMVTSNSSLGSNLPPSSYNWCTFPILGPGTLSSLDQHFVP